MPQPITISQSLIAEITDRIRAGCKCDNEKCGGVAYYCMGGQALCFDCGQAAYKQLAATQPSELRFVQADDVDGQLM
jgi:hypothetical protein